MLKRLLTIAILLWVTTLCIERSLEYKAGESAEAEGRRYLESSIPDLVVVLRAAETRKDFKGVEQALWQLAQTNWQLRRFDQADLFLGRLLVLRQTEAGTDSATLLPILQASAGVHRDWGKFDSAKRFLERAKHIDALTYGANSTPVARDINNLGVVSLLECLAIEDPGQRTKLLMTARSQLDRALSVLPDNMPSGVRSALVNNQSVLQSEMRQNSSANALSNQPQSTRQSSGQTTNP